VFAGNGGKAMGLLEAQTVAYFEILFRANCFLGQVSNNSSSGGQQGRTCGVRE